MMPALRTVRRVAAFAALASMAAFDAAQANHFILPCRENCIESEWIVTGSLHVARFRHTATLLANGKVLVAGGIDVEGNGLTSAELYDPATGAWSVTGSMTTPHVDHLAVLQPTGEVLVVGGVPSFANRNAVERYDPATGTWAPAHSQAGFAMVAATALPSGRICVVGGVYRSGYPMVTWLYDPDADTWTRDGGDDVYRQTAVATSLQNARVLLAGGTNDADYVVVVPGAELFDPDTGAWSATGAPTTPRDDSATRTVLADGSVLAAGGYTSLGEKYSANFEMKQLRSSEIYDASGTWRPVGDLGELRSMHTATLLSDGRVLVAGGWQWRDASVGVAMATAEIYDPATGSWRSTGSLNVPRTLHTATRLDDGSVLVVGGLGGSDATPLLARHLDSVEIYRQVRTAKSGRARHR